MSARSQAPRVARTTVITLAAAIGILAWTAPSAGRALAADQPPAAPRGQPHVHLYKGRVTADGLLLRGGPSRGGQARGMLRHGQTVLIKCRLAGERVAGDTYWYKLADDRWSWAAARYIATTGPAPRRCRH